MKRYFFALSMLLGCIYLAYPVSCQNLQNKVLNQTKLTENLKLSGTILEKTEMLSGDQEVSVIKLRVKFVYTNESNQPILIYKGLFLVSDFWISQDSEKAKTKEFESEVSMTAVTDDTSISNISLDDFVIISKDHPFETEETVNIFFKNRLSQSNTWTGLSKGNHLLQLNVHTWKWNKKDSEIARQKFSLYGQIATSPIITEPITLCID